MSALLDTLFLPGLLLQPKVLIALAIILGLVIAAVIVTVIVRKRTLRAEYIKEKENDKSDA